VSEHVLQRLRRLDERALDAATPSGRRLRRGAATLAAVIFGAGVGLVVGFPISILAFNGDPRSLSLLFVCPFLGALGAVAVLMWWFRRQD
jgi:hypothetical protein